MSIDNIAREEFQLYRQAQEKERQIDSIRGALTVDYAVATFSGFGTAISGVGLGFAAYGDNPGLAILNGVFALVNFGFLLSRGGKIANEYEQIGRAKAELQKIKENPAYKKLDVSE